MMGRTSKECADSPPWTSSRSCWQGSRHASVSGYRRQCGICAACLLRRTSVHAAGESEDAEAYVWEDLRALRFEEGAASAFGRKQPKGALYAIAGVLHLQHMAELSEHFEDSAPLKTEVFLPSRLFDLDRDQTRNRPMRMLGQRCEEGNGFVGSLGTSSFINQRVKGRR